MFKNEEGKVGGLFYGLAKKPGCLLPCYSKLERRGNTHQQHLFFAINMSPLSLQNPFSELLSFHNPPCKNLPPLCTSLRFFFSEANNSSLSNAIYYFPSYIYNTNIREKDFILSYL